MEGEDSDDDPGRDQNKRDEVELEVDGVEAKERWGSRPFCAGISSPRGRPRRFLSDALGDSIRGRRRTTSLYQMSRFIRAITHP